jgi:hypothetical protein
MKSRIISLTVLALSVCLLPQAAKVPAAMQVAKAMAKVRLTDFFMGYPP